MPYISDKVLRQRDKDSFDAGYKAGADINEINAELLKALRDLSDMYGHAWDLANGGLMMMEPSIPRFESAHTAAQKAIARAEGRDSDD